MTQSNSLTRLISGMVPIFPVSGSPWTLAAPEDIYLKDSASDIRAALNGKPRWLNGTLAAIAQGQGARAALIEGYRRYGRAVLDHMEGAFVLALLDQREGRVLLATDRLGIHPLFFAMMKNTLVFSTRANVVAEHPDVDDRLSAQSLYDYLFFHVVPGPETIYQGVFRLLPGECLWLENGRTAVDAYWRPRYQEPANPPSEVELQARFRDLISASVTDAAENGRVGAFLSGGTDSSTVAGMLARRGKGLVHTFSIGFDAEGYDEMGYARIAARHFGTEHHEYYVTPEDVVDAVPRIAASLDQPFGNASIVPAYYCARMAREQGMDCLLAGDGGDELFGGNTRYAKQQLFDYYGRIPHSLRHHLMEPLLLGNSLTGRIPGLRKLRSYVEQARIPMPERMETYNLLERIGAENILPLNWLDQIDPDQPHRLLRECYHGVMANNMLNRMLAVDMRFTLADSDLPKVNSACALAGIEARYPFLDSRMVAFAAGLPANQKVRGARLRYLFKESLRDFLPPEIIAKRKQGFGLPFGVWLRNHAGLRELVQESLRDLSGRGIVRREIVDELLNDRLRQHSGYFGTLIWVLMMLDQWMVSRQSSDTWSRVEGSQSVAYKGDTKFSSPLAG